MPLVLLVQLIALGSLLKIKCVLCMLCGLGSHSHTFCETVLYRAAAGSGDWRLAQPERCELGTAQCQHCDLRRRGQASCQRYGTGLRWV